MKLTFCNTSYSVKCTVNRKLTNRSTSCLKRWREKSDLRLSTLYKHQNDWEKKRVFLGISITFTPIQKKKVEASFSQVWTLTVTQIKGKKQKATTHPHTHTPNTTQSKNLAREKKKKETEVWVSSIKLTNLHPSTSKIDRVLLMSQPPFFFPTTRKEHFLVLHFLLSIHSSREGWFFFLSGQIIPQPMVLL